MLCVVSGIKWQMIGLAWVLPLLVSWNTFAAEFFYDIPILPSFQREPCRSVLEGGVRRTLGIEWEFSQVNMAVDVQGRNVSLTYSNRGLSDLALATSRFRELFAFHGINDSGEWELGLIPREVVETPRFQEMKNENDSPFVQKGESYYLLNWEGLELKKFMATLRGLMQARGILGDSLKIRKIQVRWTEFTSEMDQAISDEVAEEWNNGVFHELEFPMQGSVDHASDLRAYLRNLWLRLGLFEPKDTAEIEKALNAAVGHVHWVPDFSGLEADERRTAYASLIGFWGDANDSLLVRMLNGLKGKREPDGRVRLRKEDVEDLYRGMMGYLGTPTVAPLLNTTYRRLEARPEGVAISDRTQGLDPFFDPNLPRVFKNLPMALRGLYGPPIPEDESVVPYVGIEARTYPTVWENLAALPKKIPGKPEVDLGALSLHANSGDRGLESSPEVLRTLAKKIGVDSRLIDELEGVINPGPYPREAALAMFLLPLNPWLEHPLVLQNLKRADRKTVTELSTRLLNAQEWYRGRMSELVAARLSAGKSYQPQWEDRLREYSDGVNRVFPREDFPSISRVGELVSDPDIWFQAIVVSEMFRFIEESGLEELMRMPE